MADFTRIIDILPYQQASFPNPVALAYKMDGQWKNYSTAQCIDIINALSRGMLQMGLQKGDKIGLISPNRPEWNFVDLAMLQIGVINVPVYPTITEADYIFIFNDAAVKYVFVADTALLAKVRNIKESITSLREVFTFDRIPGARHYTDVIEMGKGVDDLMLNYARNAVEAEDLATIIYTSGTTGNPKGVMLSHHNIVSNVKSVLQILPLKPEYKTLSFLPLCHIFERTVIYTYMAFGVSIHYAESMETIADNLKEVKPQYFSTVPRLLEKVYDKIVAKGNDLTGTKRKLFYWAIDLGLEYDHTGKSLWYKMQLALARKLIFSKWQEALGGNLIGIVTGAAALQLRLERVFNAAGIAVRQGYGMTESSPVITLNRMDPAESRIGTVGMAVPGVEVKLDPANNEICCKGPNVMMGYYNRPDATAETIDKDGWLHTGDVGEWVDGKYLKITDRIKELFKTSGGKYVAPQVLENKIKESPLIEQLMIVGENEKFVGALIVPAFPNLRDLCQKNGWKGHTDTNADMIKIPEVIKTYQAEIDKMNANFSQVEKVKQFRLIPQEWTIEGGEMTPTMKLKRKKIVEKYQGYITDIYQSPE